MKRIFFLLLCFCFSVLSFAQRTNEAKPVSYTHLTLPTT